MRRNTQRTRVDGRQVLEWREQEHGNDAHAEDLHASARHVQQQPMTTTTSSWPPTRRRPRGGLALTLTFALHWRGEEGAYWVAF